MPAPRVAVAGCGGRMGQAIAHLLAETDGLALAGGFEHPGHERAGGDLVIGDRTLTVARGFGPLTATADILIDFTQPEATLNHIDICTNHQKAIVIGTTGFHPDEERQIETAARHIPIVKSGNMSLGVNLLQILVEQAAASLDDTFDIEIHDAHHRHKVDAPSGTALMLGEAAARGRGISLNEHADRGRDGITGVRKRGDIGFAVTRAGGIIGTHGVAFASDEEIITLSHTALNRALFARGALHAAKWLMGKPAGLYTMRDVLGL